MWHLLHGSDQGLQILLTFTLPPIPIPAPLPAVPPSPELVKRVRDLYHKRLPDVRFLIPVLNGLEKVRVAAVPWGTVGLRDKQQGEQEGWEPAAHARLSDVHLCHVVTSSGRTGHVLSLP